MKCIIIPQVKDKRDIIDKNNYHHIAPSLSSIMSTIVSNIFMDRYEYVSANYVNTATTFERNSKYLC